MEYELEHSDTLDDVLDEFLSHSAKGTVWKDHKYIKKENGRYYYADDKKVSKTSSDELMDEIDAIQQQMAFCDQKVKEYDELAKSNPNEAAEYKAQAKKYRDEIERLNGEREQIAKGLEKKDKHDEIVNDFRNEPLLDTLNKYKKNIYLGNPKLKHSENVLDDFLMHYGVGPDDNPPGRGSGRYPKGSGERPYQHDDSKDAGEKKKKGLFSALGAIHKALNPGFSAVDKAAEEAGRKLKEKEEAAKKTEEEKVEYDTDRPQLMREIDSPEWHDKTSVEKIKSIEKEWLNTDGDYAIYIRDPKYRETVRAAADLGLKAVEKLRGPGYIDPESDPENEREWFLFEDQTTGMPAVANFINKGYSAKQVKYIIDEIDKANDDPDTKDIFWNNHCTFQVWEGNYNDELKLFAQYCEDIKLGGKGIKHSDDLLDDFLAHYGVGPDDDPPGRGSGRYPKGSGERPFQHDPEMLAKKKKGLFAPLAKLATKITNKMEERDYAEMKKNLQNAGAWNSKMEDLFNRAKKTGEKLYDEYGDPTDDEKSKEEVRRLWGEFNAERDRLFALNKKNEQRKAALEKAREIKAANKVKAEEEKKTKEEREAEKAKAIASGDPEQISKWLSEMSNQEQFDALNRIRQTKDIKSQAAAQVKAREDAAKAEEARRKAEEEAKRPKTKKELRDEKLKEGFETAKDIMNTVDDVRQMAEKGIKFWNVIAAVNNATNSDFKLPKVDLNPGEKKKDKDKEENKEKDKNKNQQNNSGSTTNSNNTTYNTTNNYYNGEKKEETKSESEAEAETWSPSEMEDWYEAPYKYEEAVKLLLEDFMKRKK